MRKEQSAWQAHGRSVLRPCHGHPQGIWARGWERLSSWRITVSSYVRAGVVVQQVEPQNMQCQYPTQALIRVQAAPFLIHLLANVSGKAVKWRTWIEFQASGFRIGLALVVCNHLEANK